MLGGEGKGGDLGREITGIEEQILESIMLIVCRELQTAWQAIALEFKFGERQPVAQAEPGTLLSFPESISKPAVLMVDEIRLCPAMAVRVDSRRAAQILSVDRAPVTSGEL